MPRLFLYFPFYEAYSSGSFIDALEALRLYVNVDRRKLNLQLFRKIRKLAEDTFIGLKDTSTTVAVIETFGEKLSDVKYSSLRTELLGDDFAVPVFDEYDLTGESRRSMKFVENLRKLSWTTAHKLFTEVFSRNGRYMTVHQAKGLEWEKVIVAVEPGQFDKAKISEVYTDPQILQETSEEEFVRIYYVACSRAEEDLYVHLPSDFDESLIKSVFRNEDAFEIIR